MRLDEQCFFSFKLLLIRILCIYSKVLIYFFPRNILVRLDHNPNTWYIIYWEVRMPLVILEGLRPRDGQ